MATRLSKTGSGWNSWKSACRATARRGRGRKSPDRHGQQPLLQLDRQQPAGDRADLLSRAVRNGRNVGGQFFRRVLAAAEHFNQGRGLQPQTGQLLTDVIVQVLGDGLLHVVGNLGDFFRHRQAGAIEVLFGLAREGLAEELSDARRRLARTPEHLCTW